MFHAYDHEPAPPPTVVDVLPPPDARCVDAFKDPERRYSGAAYRNAMRQEDRAGFRTLTRTGFTDDHWEALAEAMYAFGYAWLPWYGYLSPRYIDAMPDPAERRWHQTAMILCDNGPNDWQVYSNLSAHALIRMLVDAERMVSHLQTLEDPLCPGRRALGSPDAALRRSRKCALQYPLPGELVRYWRASSPAATLARVVPPACFAAFEPLAPARAELDALSIESLFQIYNQLVSFGTRLDDNEAKHLPFVRTWWHRWTRHSFSYGLAIHFDTFDTRYCLRKALQSLRAGRLAFDPGNPANLRALDALGVLDGRDLPPPPRGHRNAPPPVMDVPLVYALLTEYEAFLSSVEARLASS